VAGWCGGHGGREEAATLVVEVVVRCPKVALLAPEEEETGRSLAQRSGPWVMMRRAAVRRRLGAVLAG
jgi:hypothetical protein